MIVTRIGSWAAGTALCLNLAVTFTTTTTCVCLPALRQADAHSEIQE
ncbi:hypothetical protein [Desulfogranum japonicum]|nr:hypothetical protein [Desulfogranum japonicum]